MLNPHTHEEVKEPSLYPAMVLLSIVLPSALQVLPAQMDLLWLVFLLGVGGEGTTLQSCCHLSL
jgi:hypothetical protein